MSPSKEETTSAVQPEPSQAGVPPKRLASAEQPPSAVMTSSDGHELVTKPESAGAADVSVANHSAEVSTAVDSSRPRSSTLNPLATTFSPASSQASSSPHIDPHTVDSSAVQSLFADPSADTSNPTRPSTADSNTAKSPTTASSVVSSSTTASTTGTTLPPAHPTLPKRPPFVSITHAAHSSHPRNESWSSATSSIAEAKKSFQGTPPLSLAADMRRRRSQQQRDDARRRNSSNVPHNTPTAPAAMNYDAMPRPLPPPRMQSYMSSQQALAAGHATLMANDREYANAVARQNARVTIAPDFIPGSRIPYTHFSEGVYYNVYTTSDGEVWVPAGAPVPANVERKTTVEGTWETRKAACGFDGEWEEEWGVLLKKVTGK